MTANDIRNIALLGHGAVSYTHLQHDDALAGVKAVQLGQQLVQRLLALIIAAEAAAVPGFTLNNC